MPQHAQLAIVVLCPARTCRHVSSDSDLVTCCCYNQDSTVQCMVDDGDEVDDDITWRLHHCRRAAAWLRDNTHRMVGQVLMPPAALVDEEELPTLVANERCRAQFEDNVDLRDLTLFWFEVKEDMNTFTNHIFQTDLKVSFGLMSS